MISNNVISERQAAYLKEDLTTQQLLYINHLIKSSLTKEEQVCFLDVSAGFDNYFVNEILGKVDQIKFHDSCNYSF